MPTRTLDATIVHTGDDCTLQFVNEAYTWRMLKDTYPDGAKVSVEIKSRRKPRSDKQNRFYWGNFIASQIECFLERWGEEYRPDQVHDWNKLNFFGEQRVIEATGEMTFVPGSSADKTTVEFEATLEKIRQWFAMNFDWQLPVPNEQIDLKFN